MDRAEEYNAIAERIVAHHRNDTTDQAEGIMEVPVISYSDPRRWAREVELIFKQLPVMVALTCEMPKPGDYKAFEMVGIPLLIARGKDGKPRAFINACRHRGAPIAVHGLGHANRFVCPYHGWTFRNDGSLFAVSEPHKFGQIDKDDFGLTELSCDERAGMIFAILKPGIDMDLDDWLGGMTEDVAPHGFENWHFLIAKEMTGANWKIAFDGYLEGYHFSTLHKETILKVTLNNLMEFHAFGPHMRVAYGTTNIAVMDDAGRDDLHKFEEQGFTFVRTLFPNISMYLGLGLGQIAQIIPGPTPDKNRTILYYVHPRPPKDAEEEASLLATAQFLYDVTYGEDYVLGERIQKSLNAQPFENVVFGRNERGNQYFHRWVDYYINGNPNERPPEL
ncbi:aromatic ring-hydroxylating dioxygenase subunit alpha [Emcibacter sp. SYSU 3D8]|uniref:aromatic ring-hydroxylating oxygenase subunit alpha n=1 Tax=Emcibacter sp. SYSU 3D8 TaxID=3133969 RepID=UPI0031FE69F4